ncbi:C69 family dipeptidase [Pseudomonas sp. QE6]|uniref:C69 family dipeptidase n=1 Tax=Pseudomonas sp. QE6 TaxID=3242491 RepID=UPI0035293DDA
MYKPHFALKALTAALLVGGLCQSALACTTIIAGRKATADGSVLVARLEDYTYNNHAKRFVVVPPQQYKDGDTLSFDNGVSVPAPKSGMRYTTMRDWNGDQRGALGPWSEFGANEAGVILSATNSTEPNEKAAKADPLVADEGGVIEAILPDLILPQAKTAREGVELLGKYVETLGAGETNGIQIADDKEAWLFEIGSGHHWIAVRVPDDGYVVMANGMRVHDADLNDKANVLSSAGIAEFAEKHQLLDKVDPAKFNFAKAFGIVGDAYNVDREWLVQNKLEPGRKQDIRQQQYPFYTKPEKPISVEQVAAILRIDSYAGTPLDGKKPAGDQKQRPIAMERNVEAHILQVRPQMPKGLQVLSWQSLGNVRDGLLLPYYLESLRSTPRVFQQGSDDFDEHSAWWTFRSLTSLAHANDKQYMPLLHGWRDRLEGSLRAAQPAQDEMLKALAQKDGEAARAAAERFSNGTALWALDQAGVLRANILTDLTKSTEQNYSPEELEKIKHL